MNEVRVTGDGSTTLFSQPLRRTLPFSFWCRHRIEDVFIENGLQFLRKDPVTVFEIGFGTGLNAYLDLPDSKAE